MKDFQSIPKSQIFTREQLKAIRGGDDTTYYGDAARCLNSVPCYYTESPGNTVGGYCETNSNNKCVCNAGSSSVLLNGCLR